MNRWIAVCLAAAFACVTPPATAQMGTRAYAPENLSALSNTDRARVIGQEYADQSGGRRIPDDQLRFYLSQVRSGWSFSRIRQDIATSLRGNGNGGWHGGAGGASGSIRCESQNNRERTCATGWRGARLVRQLSGSACIEGRTWGTRDAAIWVRGGCRGEFIESRRGAPGGGPWAGGNGHAGSRDGYTVTCSSHDKRRATCAWASRGRPVLVEQLSGSACQEGRSWGYGNGALWVSNGCRARFAARR